MASTPVTRASLITRINQRANTSGYVEQTQELPQLIDTSIGKLHNVLACELYEDYYQKRKLIPLVSNQPFYQLPPDFLKPRAVWYCYPASGQAPEAGPRVLLRRMDVTEETNAVTSTTNPSLPYGYILEGNVLSLSPVPQGTTTNFVLLAYIPQYVPAVNDNDAIELAIAFGWDEWVVNDVVVQIRNKAMMPANEIVAERDKFMERLFTQAKNRNPVDAPKVRNTGWRYGNGFPPWGGFSFRS